jgi:hypothetical protein
MSDQDDHFSDHDNEIEEEEEEEEQDEPEDDEYKAVRHFDTASFVSTSVPEMEVAPDDVMRRSPNLKVCNWWREVRFFFFLQSIADKNDEKLFPHNN